jgi:hypothetical protein
MLFMKKVTLTLVLLFSCFFFANAQVTCPPNIDFELGNYSYWHYYTGTCCPLTTPTYTGLGTPDLSRITLVSGTAMDACCSFPVVSPGAGAYVLKLGNTSAGTTSPNAQKARYYVHVPATGSNYLLSYRTAVALQNSAHAVSQQPRLAVKLFDSATGSPLPCNNYDITPGVAGTYTVSGCGSTPLSCKPWTTASIDLSGYAGATVGIDFATSDCGMIGHWGYAYVDLSCGLFATTMVSSCDSTLLTGPSGYPYYSWYDSSTFSPLLGTNQSLWAPAPVAPRTYAVVATPYPGFGCADTFYVRLYPPAPGSCCTGCTTLPLIFWGDVSGDCIWQPGENYNYLPVTAKVDSNGVTVDTVSVTSSINYGVYAPTGTVYTFTLLPGLLTGSCPGGSVSYTITSLPVLTAQVLGLTCAATSTPADVTVYSTVRSGSHLQRADIYATSTHCLGLGVNVSAFASPRYLPVSSFNGSPSASSTSGNLIAWGVGALSVFSLPAHFEYAVVKSGSALTIGDTVQVKCSAFATAGGDSDSSNNFTFEVDTVKASFDPNFIAVSPSGCFDDSVLQYAIHFENLGNDTAHNVYILDTLADELSVNSLRIKLASAAMNISIFKAGTHNVVRFYFPNINLLDSSQHGFNDGAVFYSIRPLPGLSLGTAISARVGIYFDYNEVVMTNAATTVKGCPAVIIDHTGVASHERKVSLYPNPAKDELIIKSEAGIYKSFTITNTVGQVMIQQELASPLKAVNIKALPAGMYYVSMQADGFSIMLKFIKN